MEVILKLWVYDRPGVLDRIAGLVRRKGWNINSLTAGDIEEGVSQINMALTGQMVEARVLCEHLAELDFLRSWEECAPDTHVMCEMLVFSVPEAEKALTQGEEIRVVGEHKGNLFAEYTATPGEINQFLQANRHRMTSCSRSGPLVLAIDPREGTEDGE